MTLETAIRERRSVRRYADREIDPAVLEEIVDLARFSPSWKNTQVVRYHMIQNEAVKEQIAREGVLNFDFNAKTILRAKTLVIVSVVKETSGYERDGSFSTSQGDRWEAFDAGLATQNFLLAAHSKGLGSVILGVFDEAKIREQITLPEEERITALIALGYPTESAKAAPPRKSVDELISYVM